MANEPFLLVSLNEDKAKKLAQVISNETCTKILNHFAQGKDGTETDIAKDLGLPLSTVHYNLKQLVDAKLVISDEYHYSSKGREVQHYRLANRYIIIAPQEERESFLKKLKSILPAFYITLAAAAIVKLASDLFLRQASSKAAAEATLMAFDSSVGAGAPAAASAAAPAAAKMLAAAPVDTFSSAPSFISNEAMLFFVGGAAFVLLVLVASAYVHRKK